MASQGKVKNYTGEITKFRPFKLQTEQTKIRSNPSLIIEVTIAPGKTGRLFWLKYNRNDRDSQK